MSKSFAINGKAKSTLHNYMRCLAHLGLHYKQSPEKLSKELIDDYLFHCQNLHKTPSESFFKHTIFGLRAIYKVLNMEDKRVKLPQIKRQNKLPVVLSKAEVRALLKAPKYLKHRLMLGMLYGCGLRSYELCALRLSDVDFDRMSVFVKKQKGKLDRYVPLSKHLARGLKKYISTESPTAFLFNSQVTDNGAPRPITTTAIQWVIKENRSKVNTHKTITAHCLRHTYATHLLEEGLNIMSLKELLNVPYFHVVFTLPSELDTYALSHPRIVYGSLFKAAWATLGQFGANPKHLGAKTGMIAILHTWGQNLSLHPHLHCIVPGGGVNRSGKWKPAKNKGKYLFNVKSMGKVFQAKYVALLRKEKVPVPPEIYDNLFAKSWVVYAKQQFHTPKYVVEYLGRYTHKIAISNYRIKQIDKAKGEVLFTTKNYKKGGKKEVLKLSTHEFTRRFALHVLPKGFMRIRHYGILSSGWKKEKLPALQKMLSITPVKAVGEKPTPLHGRCPSCKKGKLVTLIVSSP